MTTKIAIQGYPGSFHDEVCQQYFGSDVDVVPCSTFDKLGHRLHANEVDFAIMAIENSIAGTILQNYRILREQSLHIIGERNLRIKHNLLTYQDTDISDIEEIHSHPMAINQCLTFLNQYPSIKLVESEDTALSAKRIQEKQNCKIASISSTAAANLYDLHVMAEGIEDNPVNYTRFLVLSNQQKTINKGANKASIYIRIPDVKGQLLRVLQLIDIHDLNMSKLQSFPVMGKLREYFFHLDIEFDSVDSYHLLKTDLQAITHEFTELGTYKSDPIFSIHETPSSI